MKKHCIQFLLLPILCGCSYINSKLPVNPPTQQEQFCSEIKRNIIFNTASNTSVGGAASATQQAEMMRLYAKKDCGQVLKK